MYVEKSISTGNGLEPPFLNAAQAQEKTGLSAPTVNKAFDALEALGIVGEITGKQRGRVFAYAEFLKILESGTEVRQAAG